MIGTLYIVATPIGAASDLSPRARDVLASVDRIAAEDTRVTLRLLQQLGLSVPVLTSYHDHNERDRSTELVARLVAGERIALVSDAGTPLVSDPGFRLVTEAVDAGVPIIVVPGPCAAVAALSGAGLPPDRFLFLGFLPRDAGPRAAAIAERATERATLIWYEAPHRLLGAARDLLAQLGPRRAAIAHNLTKQHERWRRGSLEALVAELAAEDEIRGEITVVVEGFQGDLPEDPRMGALVTALVAAGVPVGTVRDVVAEVYDRPRREVYQLALAARREEP